MNTARLLVPIFTLQDFLYLLLDFLLAGFLVHSLHHRKHTCLLFSSQKAPPVLFFCSMRKKVKNEGKIGMFREQKNLLPRFLNFFTPKTKVRFSFLSKEMMIFLYLFLYLFLYKRFMTTAFLVLNIATHFASADKKRRGCEKMISFFHSPFFSLISEQPLYVFDVSPI